VTIVWSVVAGATSYNLYWSTEPGLPPAERTRIANVTSPFVHMGLANGTGYFYLLSSEDDNGESVAALELEAVPAAEIGLSIIAPRTNAVVGGGVPIETTVTSNLAVASVAASIGEQATGLVRTEDAWEGRLTFPCWTAVP
jgi:hypothetical protein